MKIIDMINFTCTIGVDLGCTQSFSLFSVRKERRSMSHGDIFVLFNECELYLIPA